MKKAIFALLLLAASAYAQSYGALTGNCTIGNQNVQTSGLPSTNVVMASFPQCLVAVYATGTTNLSTLYSNATGTALANPFTANTDGSWLFFAGNGGYDIVMSGGQSGGFPTPVTLTAVYLCSSYGACGTGGGGAGNPAAPNTSVQFNNGGVFGGSADFTWDGTNAYVGQTGAQMTAGEGFFNLNQTKASSGFTNPFDILLTYTDNALAPDFGTGTVVEVKLDQFGQLIFDNSNSGNPDAFISPNLGSQFVSTAHAVGSATYRALRAQTVPISGDSGVGALVGGEFDVDDTNLTDGTVQRGIVIINANHHTSTGVQTGVDVTLQSNASTSASKFIAFAVDAIPVGGIALSTGGGLIDTGGNLYANVSGLCGGSPGGVGLVTTITDSATATWGATITGSGSNHVLAYCNGTVWTVAAK